MVFPVHLAPKLIAVAEQLFHRVDRFGEMAMNPAADQGQLASEGKGLAEGLGTVETMRFNGQLAASAQTPTRRTASRDP